MPIKEINAGEFIELAENGKKALEIVDVRSPEEFNLISIKDSKLIPLGELAGRMAEIDRNKTVVFICRSGARSRVAVRMAQAAKLENIFNLEGGIYGLWKDGGKKYLQSRAENEELISGYFS